LDEDERTYSPNKIKSYVVAKSIQLDKAYDDIQHYSIPVEQRNHSSTSYIGDKCVRFYPSYADIFRHTEGYTAQPRSILVFDPEKEDGNVINCVERCYALQVSSYNLVGAPSSTSPSGAAGPASSSAEFSSVKSSFAALQDRTYHPLKVNFNWHLTKSDAADAITSMEHLLLYMADRVPSLAHKLLDSENDGLRAPALGLTLRDLEAMSKQKPKSTEEPASHDGAGTE
jgi:hypothetical protein